MRSLSHVTACILAGALASLAACSDGAGDLSGSLLDTYPLRVRQTRIRFYEGVELSVEYVGARESVPLRLSVPVPEGDLSLLPREVVLEERGGRITGRTVEGRDLVGFSAGAVRFSSLGERVEGSFTASFVSGGDTLSLAGDFSSDVESVSVTLPAD